MEDFIKPRPDLGLWDVDQIIEDLEQLLVKNGYDFNVWAGTGDVLQGPYKGTAMPDMNLTSNPQICPTIHDQLWKYSGRRYSGSLPVEDGHLHHLIPELDGTYTGDMIRFLIGIFGPIRVRLHNRVNHTGLYWHNDAHAEVRHHLALWTNHGHFLVWTDFPMDWQNGVNKEQSSMGIKINAEFIPMDGMFRTLNTGRVIHGVANIGIGWQQPASKQSRCHLTFWPVNTLAIPTAWLA